jgi:hypothetical protein
MSVRCQLLEMSKTCSIYQIIGVGCAAFQTYKSLKMFKRFSKHRSYRLVNKWQTIIFSETSDKLEDCTRLIKTRPRKLRGSSIKTNLKETGIIYSGFPSALQSISNRPRPLLCNSAFLYHSTTRRHRILPLTASQNQHLPQNNF